MTHNTLDHIAPSPATDRDDGARPVGLITGASRGLGATIAELLAGSGVRLLLTARGAEELRATADKLVQGGAEVLTLPGDVADPDHRRQLAAAARRLGRLDVLVNNASALGPTPLPRLADYPLEDLERVFGTNVLAPLALVQETLPLLAASQGLVVNVSSDAARGGYPGWGGYGSTKAALDLLSLTLAGELEADGVSVVSVDPGDLRTRMHQRAFPGEDISDRPLPAATLPFWAWLFGQPHAAVNGQRYQAQGDHWEVHS